MNMPISRLYCDLHMPLRWKPTQVVNTIGQKILAKQNTLLTVCNIVHYEKLFASNQILVLQLHLYHKKLTTWNKSQWEEKLGEKNKMWRYKLHRKVNVLKAVQNRKLQARCTFTA